MQKRICAVVVTFNPDIDRLAQLIIATTPQVEQLVIVDNGSRVEVVEYLQKQENKDISLISLSANLGIATALNKGIQHAIDNGFSHVLLLDHDSIPDRNMVSVLYGTLNDFSEDKDKIAAVGPASFIDIKTMERESFIRFGWLRRASLNESSPESFTYADMLLTSGTLIPISAIKKVGMMDESLFVDHVDHEWCFRATSKDMKLIGVKNATMSHSLGDRAINVRFFKKMVVIVHSPIRLYYLVRNTLLLARKSYVPKRWIFRGTISLIRRFIIFSLFVNPRYQNFSMMLKGAVDGLMGKSGKLEVR